MISLLQRFIRCGQYTPCLLCKIELGAGVDMRSVVILTIMLFLAASGRGAEPPDPTLPMPGSKDVFHGTWDVYLGREDGNVGTYFESSVVMDSPLETKCAVAGFQLLPSGDRRVVFTAEPGFESAKIPLGSFGYEYDPSGRLSLTTSDRPTIKCFVKYVLERKSSISVEEEAVRPYLLVFYDLSANRAFKLVRQGSQIGLIKIDPGGQAHKKIFVPFQDVLTGPWLLAPGQPVAGGRLEFAIRTQDASRASRLVVLPNNDVQVSAEGVSASLRLRQYDPRHWAIESADLSRRELGTLAVEDSVEGLLGNAFLLTRWDVNGRKMTALLQSSDAGVRPRVSIIRCPGAEPLQINLLRALSPADSE